MLSETTVNLFSPFLREVGCGEKYPHRMPIKYFWQFRKFIDAYNGISDCFVSVYPLNSAIDKIFLDFDGESAVRDAQKVYSYLISEGFSVIPVFSGKRGIHLYVLLRPTAYVGSDVQRLLLGANIRIKRDVFNGGQCSLDTHLFGNLRALCRIPNTLRPPDNTSYCTYLPSLDFLSMSKEEVLMSSKHQNDFKYNMSTSKTLLDLKCNNIELEEVVSKIGSQIDITIENKDLALLKPLFRPCLFRRLREAEPCHIVRVAAAMDLFSIGFTDDDIVKIFRKFGWVDWSEDITRYQLGRTRAKFTRTYGCKKLRAMGVPVVCCSG